MEEVKKQGVESLFVPYKIALALKELWFDEPCLAFSYIKSEFGYIKHQLYLVDSSEELIKNSDKDYYYARPTWQQVFRWFREKHFLHSHITCSCTVNEILSYDWTIHKIMNAGTREENFITDYERTYEEAELECLKKLIEILYEQIKKKV